MNKLSLAAQRQLFNELNFLLRYMPGQLAQHLQTLPGKKLKVYLQRGLSLADSYRYIGGDPVIVGLLAASSNSLSLVIPEVYRYYDCLETLFKTLRKQLLYPLITCFVALLVIIGFFIFVYPLLQGLLPQEKQEGSAQLWVFFMLCVGLVVNSRKQLYKYFLDWTQLPELLRKMQIVLLIRLAPDTATLITMLQQYNSQGALARSCFQLRKGVGLVVVLRQLAFTEQELLLVQQAEISGDKDIYQDLVSMLREGLEARVNYLTQLIEPGVTLATGVLVAGCVYVMLRPILQLQQGLS